MGRLSNTLRNTLSSSVAHRKWTNKFSPPHRDFLGLKHPEEYLRIRVKGGGGAITYKKVYFNEKDWKTHADEYESKIDDTGQFFDNRQTKRKLRI